TGWRDHRKLMLVDHRTAFVGGVNLCREGADRREGGSGWRDAAVLLRGPLVAELAGSFERSWGEQGARPRRLAAPPPCAPAPAGPVAAYVLESPPAGGARFGSAL